MNKERIQKLLLYIFCISILYFGVRQQLVATTDDLQKKNLNPVAAPDL